ncbi:MFS general substrate transporter [Aspergillus heteromorphus CBS 117.55]|uniref:MFS general substrate transporter n=1 Tax=Aspergillus heteromorphus CBS 117.55 TaxID=1448321 RepID=A0A317WPG8_9EURO|nr:MFS general substrate transporter [Aspergillus heteromorphus CBS 117.55]PWY86778.1 MFS general substrate transporter [Aspergillus heteromorphus CBS 117.55]
MTQKTSVSNDRDPAYIVSFDKGDPDDPKNFSSWYKACLTFQMTMTALVGALGSSILAPGQSAIAEYVNVSEEVAVLATSLYILGWAVGPALWGPVSEVYGRRLGMLPAVFCLGLFSVGTAASKNAASIFITRFIGGVFGSAPISNVGAALSDLYNPKERGTAVTFLAMCITGGPTLAPIIGSAIVTNPMLDWRWLMWIEAILAFAIAIIATFALRETYAPVLLKRKAQETRKKTRNERYWHPHEGASITIENAATKHFVRPLRMLLTESIMACICLYASFTYSLIYLCLQVYPIVFEDERKYSPVISSLPFLGILIGVMCALAINFANQAWYAKAMRKNSGKPVPEARLPPTIIGGVFLPLGFFWFGWTAAPRYPWILPTIAGGFIGAGFNIIFQQCLNYLIDTYGPCAASAIAANTMLRSLLAAGIPLAAKPMFNNLGVGPAASLLGGIACLALPIPLIFMKYGPALRRKSAFAPVDRT